MDDEKLIIMKAQKGDSVSFETLYSRYCKRLFRYILRKVNLISEAEDISSEVWFQILKSLKNFNFQSKFFTWVVSISNNILQKYYKSKYNAKKVEFDEDYYEVVEISEVNPEIEKKKANALKAVFSVLSENAKKVFYLRYLKGYSVQEVAEKLHLTESNVKVINHRSLKNLQGIFGGVNIYGPRFE